MSTNPPSLTPTSRARSWPASGRPASRCCSSLLAAACAALAVVAAACGGGSAVRPAGSTPTVPPSTATPPAATTTALPPASATSPAVDCAPARPHAAGNTSGTIVSGGIERRYLLEVPPAYDGGGALPVVINLHGFSSSAEEQAAYSGFPAKGAAEGFIVVTPQGVGDPPFWNMVGVALLQDDVAFISDLLDALESQLCIDPQRVYATGISNGAGMSNRLACDLSGRIAAIGTVAGTAFPVNCAAPRPVPVIAFHGTADPLVPYAGGPINAGLSLRLNLQAPPAEEAIASWAEHNGCTTGPSRESVSAHVERIAYDGCDAGASVELYAIAGGGHTWPGASDVPRLGATTHEISATELIWAFFAAHPMP